MVEVNGKAYLQFLLEEDTLLCMLKNLLANKKLEKKILAYNKVKFFKLDLQGKM